MDIEANWTEILGILADEFSVNDHPLSSTEHENHDRLLELLAAGVEWILSGGFAPAKMNPKAAVRLYMSLRHDYE